MLRDSLIGSDLYLQGRIVQWRIALFILALHPRALTVYEVLMPCRPVT